MSRQDIESFVKSRLDEISERLMAASGDESLYPDGLTRNLERCLSFSQSAAWSISPPVEETASSICAAIDRERDKRIDSGFTFRGNTYQSRPSDRENVMGAAQLALAYLGAGGDPSSLRWANPDADFVWIAADNQTLPLTAADVVALFQAGVAFKSALTFYARAMKDAVIADEDPSSVEWRDNWPA